MYTNEYIVHMYVHKCEYTCAYNVYPAKESVHNNVHVRTCTLYVYHTKIRSNSHNE